MQKRVCTAIQFLLALTTVPVGAEEWRHYGSDPGGTCYSPLDQTYRSNVDCPRRWWWQQVQPREFHG